MQYTNLVSKGSLRILTKFAKVHKLDLEDLCRVMCENRIPVNKFSMETLKPFNIKTEIPEFDEEDDETIAKKRYPLPHNVTPSIQMTFFSSHLDNLVMNGKRILIPTDQIKRVIQGFIEDRGIGLMSGSKTLTNTQIKDFIQWVEPYWEGLDWEALEIES